ncbi:hypothetical protein F443_15287, partial [Phytophthora nicotianae P1569]
GACSSKRAPCNKRREVRDRMDELLVNALIDMALASWERPRKDSA